MRCGRSSLRRSSVPTWCSQAPILPRSIAPTIAARHSVPSSPCLTMPSVRTGCPVPADSACTPFCPTRAIRSVSSSASRRPACIAPTTAVKRGRRRNKGVKMDGGPPHAPHFGPQCAHKMRYDAKNPARIYLQNHPGVYRSDDGGDSWIDIHQGLPSEFGFPLVAHPRRGDTAYLIPLESDNFRVPLEGAVNRIARPDRSAKDRDISGSSDDRTPASHLPELDPSPSDRFLGASQRANRRVPQFRRALHRTDPRRNIPAPRDKS
jgi:hypothetical protein